MGSVARLAILLSVTLMGLPSGAASAQGQPDGQLTVAFDASIASSFLDPAETPGLGTPFVFLYALHDALIKPRENLRFHNGDPFTAEDVKFSFLRYRGVSAKLLHDRVKAVEVVDPYRVRFVLMHERVMHGPIFEPATLHGVGPRVEKAAIELNPQLYFAAPYEDIRLKKQ